MGEEENKGKRKREGKENVMNEEVEEGTEQLEVNLRWQEGRKKR